MTTSKKRILQMIKMKVLEVDPLAEVILYGSRARGDEGSGSDWDILILTNDPVSVEKEKIFRHRLFDLELEIEEVFSTFVYHKNDWHAKMRITPFYRNIQKEGIML